MTPLGACCHSLGCSALPLCLRSVRTGVMSGLGACGGAAMLRQRLRHSSLCCWSAYRPQAPPGAHTLPAHSHNVVTLRQSLCPAE